MDTKEIGRELKGLRAKNGLSRKAVSEGIVVIKDSDGESISINTNSLRAYEKDIKNCPTSKLLALLEFYQENPSIFFSKVCANKHKK